MVELIDSSPAPPVVQYLIAFCSRPEAVSDVVSGGFVMLIVLDKCVKFRDPHLHRFREHRPKAVEDGIFFNSFFHGNFRLEVASEVISGVAVE